MEKKIKQQIVDASEAVKRKVRKMRDIETNQKYILDSVFEPITKPLKEIAEKKVNNIDIENKFETSSPLDINKTLRKRVSMVGFNESNPTIGTTTSDDSEDEISANEDSFRTVLSESGLSEPSEDISSWSMSPEAIGDVPFGVRNERGKLMMGSARVVVKDDFIQVGASKYKVTPGIKELLFKRIPDTSIINSEDLGYYKLMLLETNVHRRDYNPQKPLKSNKGRKYLNIIKPLFKLRKVSASTDSQTEPHTGEGLPLLKKWKKNVDYVYWDDPNELIDRLKLLIASRDAGNTGLDNEILSIIEELRENGIISNK